METVITINPKELNARLLNKLKRYTGKEKGLEIQISIKKPARARLRPETKAQVRSRINQAIEDIEKGKHLVKFSGFEFETLTELLLKKAS